MQTLQLSIIPGGWRFFVARKRDKRFAKFSEKVWMRDNYTCRYCGFQAKQYQEVVNADRNFRNNKLSNLVTACCFCTQCFFLEQVGQGEYGGGTLIYLPEISQSDLNGLCHVLFCAIANATDYRTDAQNIYRNLKLRSKTIEEKLGESMINPATLGQILANVTVDPNESLPSWLSYIRLLPARAKFTQQIEAWAAAALEEMSAE